MSERKNFYKNGIFLNEKKNKFGCPHLILQGKKSPKHENSMY